jgi:cellulose synthase/poly-beta-1,6-N-acetylglucosamine synthase-like glycosyltransferase
MGNFLDRLKMRMANFMQGRNGMDDFARAESMAVLVIIIVEVVLSMIFSATGLSSSVIGSLLLSLINLLFWVLIIHMYFRVFSRNISKRYAENQKFVNFRYRMVAARSRRKKERAQRGAYKFFSCPICKQRVRVPKGRGKICITCPKCRSEFTKRS